jgi:putative acetyltransferase
MQHRLKVSHIGSKGHRLRDLGARGCGLVGHPAYYRRFGFEIVRGLAQDGVPEEVFLVLSFDGHIPHGSVECHAGFAADGSQEDDSP